MSDLTLAPFYEGGRGSRLGLTGKLMVAGGLGLVFLALVRRPRAN